MSEHRTASASTATIRHTLTRPTLSPPLVIPTPPASLLLCPFSSPCILLNTVGGSGVKQNPINPSRLPAYLRPTCAIPSPLPWRHPPLHQRRCQLQEQLPHAQRQGSIPRYLTSISHTLSITPTSLPPAFNTVDGGTGNNEYIGKGHAGPWLLTWCVTRTFVLFHAAPHPSLSLPVLTLVPIASFPHLRPIFCPPYPSFCLITPSHTVHRHMQCASSASSAECADAVPQVVHVRTRTHNLSSPTATLASRPLIHPSMPPVSHPRHPTLVTPVYPYTPTRTRTRTRTHRGCRDCVPAPRLFRVPHTSSVLGQLRVVARGRPEFACARTRCCTDTGASAPHASRLPSFCPTCAVASRAYET
ncbi:hypothetical protein C8F04DRAFT_1401384 [Mycena alexandri]|uniref:Uncharacterized protein n=1 Tax=Mycena alexandri TaxID=1745969 RepID=A0AAD6SC35_9AGAR|nr:hypothetical protein C8F04DRAFT_1401384 [Mycena alexandri]